MSAIAAKRLPILKRMITGQKLSAKQWQYLANKVPIERAEYRLKVLSDPRVPVRGGISFLLNASKADFEAYAKRHIDVYDYLKGKGVSEEIALKLCNKQHPKADPTKVVRAMVEFLEAFELDAKVYGHKRIPVNFYEVVLHKGLNILKNQGIRRAVLWPMEVEHATKVLDKQYPWWRDVKSFSDVSSARVLRNIRAGKGTGRNPTMSEIASNAPITIIRNTKARFATPTPEGLRTAREAIQGITDQISDIRMFKSKKRLENAKNNKNSRLNVLIRRRKRLHQYISGKLPSGHRVAKILAR